MRSYLVALVILAFVTSCPGDYDGVQLDTGSSTRYDGLYWPNPDLPRFPDSYQPDTQYQWPDTAPKYDGFQWPDTYSGAPFGCRTDNDCFGLRCCDTPWGVKLCSQVCQ